MNIKVYENQKNNYMGIEVLEGYKEAWNTEIRKAGVVDEKTGEFKVTLPLNGYRGRNLAEEVFGNRSTSEWTLGRAVVVPVKNLQDLPGFDQYYIDVLDTIAQIVPVVSIQVVRVDPTYGVHITVSVAKV